eukprot:COSAG04_NODE_1272_length_7468_cov_3.407518_3_plen_1629_part_00
MADGAEQHSEALLQQMEREEAAMKIQAVHRGNAARSKLEARLSRKETGLRAAAARAEQRPAGAMEQHLASIGFMAESAKSYAAVLIEEGFESPAAFATLTIEELREDFGFKRGHLRLVATWKAEQAEQKAVGKTDSGGKSDEAGVQEAVTETVKGVLTGALEQTIEVEEESWSRMLGMSLFTLTKVVIELVLGIFFLISSIESCIAVSKAMKGCVGTFDQCIPTMLDGEKGAGFLSGCGLNIANNGEYTQWADGCKPRADAIMWPVVAPSATSVLLSIGFAVSCIGRIVKRIRARAASEPDGTPKERRSKMAIIHYELERMKVRDTALETLIFILAIALFAYRILPKLMQKTGLKCGASFCPNDFEASLLNMNRNIRCDEGSVFITAFSNCTQLWTVDGVTECSQSGSEFPDGMGGCCVPIDLFFPCQIDTCTVDVCDVKVTAIKAFRRMYLFNAGEDVWDLSELLVSILAFRDGLSSIWAAGSSRKTRIGAGVIILTFFISLVLGLLLFLPASEEETLPWTPKNDGCAAELCGNHSRCMDLRDDEGGTGLGVECVCDNGWGGPTCREELACASSPCQAGGGTCDDQTDGSFVCICNQGFSGELCDNGLGQTCPDIGLPGYDGLNFAFEECNDPVTGDFRGTWCGDEIPGAAWVTQDGFVSNWWQDGARVPAQCVSPAPCLDDPLGCSKRNVAPTPENYHSTSIDLLTDTSAQFMVDDPLAQQAGCLFVTSLDCVNSDADPSYAPECDGEACTEDNFGMGGVDGPMGELVAAALDDGSRTTAGGNCLISGCKVPVYPDGQIGTSAAFTLQRCSTCEDGDPDWEAVGGCPTQWPNLCEAVTGSGFSARCRADGLWTEVGRENLLSFYEPVCVGVSCETVTTNITSSAGISTVTQHYDELAAAGVEPVANALSYSVSSKWPQAYPSTHKFPCRGIHGAESLLVEVDCTAQGGTWNSCCADPSTADSSCCTAAPWRFCKGGFGDVCEFTCAPGYHREGTLTCEFATPTSLQPEFRGGICAPNACTGGLTVPDSPTICAGNVGDECLYTCDAGKSASTPHVCGTDGVFRGGACTPCSDVLQEMLDWLETASAMFTFCPTTDVTTVSAILEIPRGKHLVVDGSGAPSGSITYHGLIMSKKGRFGLLTTVSTHFRTGLWAAWDGHGPVNGAAYEDFSALGLGAPLLQAGAGEKHNIWLLEDGTAWATGLWSDQGPSRGGELGIGPESDNTAQPEAFVHGSDSILAFPKAVRVGWTMDEPLDDIVQVAVQETTTVLLKSDGTVWRTGTIAASVSPAQRSDRTDLLQTDIPQILSGWDTDTVPVIVHVSNGGLYSLMVSEEGHAYGVGSNRNGQLGMGCLPGSSGHYTDANQYSPRRSFRNRDPSCYHCCSTGALLDTRVSMASAGGLDSSFWLGLDGAVWAAGSNDAGQLGVGSDVGVTEYNPGWDGPGGSPNAVPSPTRVTLRAPAKEVAAGWVAGGFLLQDGTVYGSGADFGIEAIDGTPICVYCGPCTTGGLQGNHVDAADEAACTAAGHAWNSDWDPAVRVAGSGYDVFLLTALGKIWKKPYQQTSVVLVDDSGGSHSSCAQGPVVDIEISRWSYACVMPEPGECIGVDGSTVALGFRDCVETAGYEWSTL